MPYGYEKYRLSKGLSPKTTYVEIKVIQELMAFVNTKYKKQLEPREIKPIDIREFLLEQKKEKDLKDATLNRKLIAIKNWFDYLWQINKLELDFMPKFSLPKKLEKTNEKINLNYENLLAKKRDILKSNTIRLYGKMLFLLYMNGFRVRDIVKITLDQIEDKGEQVIIKIHKSNGCIQKAIFVDEEIGIILDCIEKAIFRGTSYLLSSKINNEYIPLQLGSFKDYMNSIKEFLGFPFKSEQVRYAYVHFLYTKKKYKVEDLQEILGLPLTTVTLTLKEALERVQIIDYNKENQTNK
jgi:integrase/recombinase XerD